MVVCTFAHAVKLSLLFLVKQIPLYLENTSNCGIKYLRTAIPIARHKSTECLISFFVSDRELLFLPHFSFRESPLFVQGHRMMSNTVMFLHKVEEEHSGSGQSYKHMERDCSLAVPLKWKNGEVDSP